MTGNVSLTGPEASIIDTTLQLCREILKPIAAKAPYQDLKNARAALEGISRCESILGTRVQEAARPLPQEFSRLFSSKR